MSDKYLTTIRNLSGLAPLSAMFVSLALVAAAQKVGAQQGAECLECHTGLPATAANLIPEETEEQIASATCDYSSADLFDGWGWNPVTRESCPPLEGGGETTETSSNCDYTNADLYDGWGWDPVARQSCPPLESSDPHARFPICSATFYDAEGDGFGWENEASCIVTSDSTPPPVFTNQQTGNQVDLVRAYWDGNSDLADRVVQCDLYYYDSYSMTYRTEDFPFRAGAGINNQVFPAYRFHHLALPPESPFEGFIADAAYVDNGEVLSTPLAAQPFWTTDDGRYIGPTVLQDPYLELVTRNSGAQAVRLWVNSRQDTALDLLDSGNRVRRDGYFECYDISGRDLRPTGRQGGGTNSPRVLSDLVVSSEGLSGQAQPEAIRNLDTGSDVSLRKAFWNYNQDLGGRSFSCESNVYLECDDCPTNYMPIEFFEYSFAKHFTSSGNRIHFTSGPVLGLFNESFLVENGVVQLSDYAIGGIFGSPYIEDTSQGVRFWTDSEFYTECIGISPTGTEPAVVNNNQCDYSSADAHDGWGWNSVTRTSCPPVSESSGTDPVETEVTDGCDYSNAGLDGWGWNPVTRTSCAPLTSGTGNVPENTESDNCDYSSAGSDGWGWNPVSLMSCPPLTQTPTADNCDYSSAGPDGWGWDPVARLSCPPR